VKLRDVTFFVDRSLGNKRLAGMLSAAGFQIRIHDEHFKQDEVDPVWLKVCGERGWVF
jgi:hypothetical protein